MKPKISIVIPVYNHLSDCLQPLIASLFKFTNMEDKEIIIVANGCTDGTEDFVWGLNDNRVRLIRFEKPLGYTRAANVGIQNARGDYVILLNSDCVLMDQHTDDWVNLLMRPFEEDAKVAISGVTEIWDQHSGYDFIIFFCAMIPMAVIRELGLLAEDFGPGGGEDIEYAIRAQRAGYKIRQVPRKENEIWSYHTPYPIYHAAEATVRSLPYWEGAFQRNMDLLRRTHRQPIKYSIVVAASADPLALQKCIRSIWLNTSYHESEVIIVYHRENQPEHAYIEALKNFGPYRLVPTDTQLSASAALKRGLEESAGTFVLFVSGNTVLLAQEKNDWVKYLTEPLTAADFASPVINDGETMLFCCGARREALRGIKIDERLPESLALAGKKSAIVPILPVYFAG